MYRHTQTHKRKDSDIQCRKDMDVLKIAQNPLNLQTSEMVKACVRRQDHCPYQASGILKQKAPKYLRLLRGGRRACSQQVLGSSGGSDARLSGDKQPGCSVQPPPPLKEITLYGTKVGWEQTRPRGHSIGRWRGWVPGDGKR